MPAKKKTKKKASSAKKTAGRKAPVKQRAQKRRTPNKRAKKKVPANKASNKREREKPISAKPKSGTSTKSRNKSRRPVSSAISQETSGLQSGDLQGLSHVESADSESVDELMEEGNAFEAGIVSGVEDSGRREGKEVRTREVPEDDVPGEYLDEE